MYTLTVVDNPAPADIERVRAGLAAYNLLHAGDDSYQPLTIFVYDASGAVVGGLLGDTYWGWLAIAILWLAEDVRGQGWGSQLLAAAEGIARDRGCHAAHLDTMSFQARAFYERHGYVVFGVLDDLPYGHQRYFLRKSLPRAAPA
jgi:GNAT superfamily N-acetyltransferase